MRTNIVLDDDLVEEASKLTGIKTKKQLIHVALKLLIEKSKRKSLLDIAGKVEFSSQYDHKKLRSGKKK